MYLCIGETDEVIISQFSRISSTFFPEFLDAHVAASSTQTSCMGGEQKITWQASTCPIGQLLLCITLTPQMGSNNVLTCSSSNGTASNHQCCTTKTVFEFKHSPSRKLKCGTLRGFRRDSECSVRLWYFTSPFRMLQVLLEGSLSTKGHVKGRYYVSASQFNLEAFILYKNNLQPSNANS